MNNKDSVRLKMIVAILGAILCGMVGVFVFLVLPGRQQGSRQHEESGSSVAQGSPQQENPGGGEIQKAEQGSEEQNGTGAEKKRTGKQTSSSQEKSDEKSQAGNQASSNQGKSDEKSQAGKQTSSEQGKSDEKNQAGKQTSSEQGKSDEKSQEGKKSSSGQENPPDNKQKEEKQGSSGQNNSGSKETPAVVLGKKETTQYQSYSDVIEALENEYGALTLKIHDEPLTQYANGAEYMVEVNGLCYLSLIDFDNDGSKELLAVVKHESDVQYTVMVYVEEDGNVTQVMSSTKLTDADWYGNYLCLVTDQDLHIYFNREQFGGEWQYDEIYGYENGTFKLRSISCWEYKAEDGSTVYYIVEEVPEVVNSEKLNKRLVSEEDYHKEAPLAVGNTGIENRRICLKYPQADSDIQSGSFYDLDVNMLQDSINQVKKELSGSSQGQGGMSGNGSGDVENEAWKQAYTDCIETDPDIDLNDDWCTCGLIYLDQDEIPELIIQYGTEAAGTKIVSYKNGEIVSCQFSRNGGIQYLEREGYVYNSAGVMGVMYDELALLDEAGFHDLGRGFRVDENQTFENYTIFNWNEEEVSEEEYYSQLSIFDSSGAQKWNSFSGEYQDNQYSAYDMCEYLSEN